MSTLRRGLIAGAAGTTALNVVTYLDMALRGRPASTAPGKAVDRLGEAAGRTLPGGRAERANRREGIGAVLGLSAGLGLGVVAALGRAAGVRLPRPLGGVATGALAMAATDVPMAALGLTDPRTWTAADWLSDVVPHLAYGAVTHSALVASEGPGDAPRRAPASVVLRSALLGVAAGGRSTLAAAGPTLAAAPSSRKARASLLAVAGELVADKLPTTPSRLEGPSLAVRVAAGAGGGAALAKGAGCAPAAPAAVGAAGALAGSYAGAAWRTWSSVRAPALAGALVEDVVAVALAVLASRSGREAAPAAMNRRGPGQRRADAPRRAGVTGRRQM